MTPPVEPDEITWHAYFDGTLPDAERVALEAWLAAHPGQRLRVEELARLHTALREESDRHARDLDVDDFSRRMWEEVDRHREQVRGGLVRPVGNSGAWGWAWLPVAAAAAMLLVWRELPKRPTLEGVRSGHSAVGAIATETDSHQTAPPARSAPKQGEAPGSGAHRPATPGPNGAGTIRTLSLPASPRSPEAARQNEIARSGALDAPKDSRKESEGGELGATPQPTAAPALEKLKSPDAKKVAGYQFMGDAAKLESQSQAARLDAATGGAPMDTAALWREFLEACTRSRVPGADRAGSALTPAETWALLSSDSTWARLRATSGSRAGATFMLAWIRTAEVERGDTERCPEARGLLREASRGPLAGRLRVPLERLGHHLRECPH